MKLQILFALVIVAALCLDHGVDAARRRRRRRRRRRNNDGGGGGGLTAVRPPFEWRCGSRDLTDYLRSRSTLTILRQACIELPQPRRTALSCTMSVKELPQPLTLPFTIRCAKSGWKSLSFGGAATPLKDTLDSPANIGITLGGVDSSDITFEQLKAAVANIIDNRIGANVASPKNVAVLGTLDGSLKLYFSIVNQGRPAVCAFFEVLQGTPLEFLRELARVSNNPKFETATFDKLDFFIFGSGLSADQCAAPPTTTTTTTTTTSTTTTTTSTTTSTTTTSTTTTSTTTTSTTTTTTTTAMTNFHLP